jgi:ferredoxin
VAASDDLAASAGAPAGAESFDVTIEPGGYSFNARADRPLLRSAEDAGLVLPSSCRNGTCRTCIALAVHGHVAYAIEWPGVSAEEKKEGWILPCIAMPRSDLTLQVEAFSRFDD